ncbi:MAG TPA: hypothetical protein VE863_15950 [Pyrinomonadaceae bacterium]|jgi:hypothetical protein|nr:hypothetical protein [Pyrinomonadaceae bacterium]
MNWNRIFLTTIGIVLMAVSVTFSQGTPKATSSPSQPNAPKQLPAGLEEFFVGEWTGAGELSNGRNIEADVSFAADLDNQWLNYSHNDRAPNKYKARGMWGFERNSGRFVMLLNDNFGGARLFVSDGWLDGRIVFNSEKLLVLSSVQERFTFARESATTFRMTYEISRDGKTWRIGDYLIFRRK